MAVGEICSREVVYIRRDESVAAAARLMREAHVGCLVVADENNGKRMPAGMLTDRDITVAVVAPGLDAGIAEAVELMRLRGIRRFPVTDSEGSLVGLLASDDILSLLAEEISGLAGMVSREEKRERMTRKTTASNV